MITYLKQTLEWDLFDTNVYVKGGTPVIHIKTYLNVNLLQLDPHYQIPLSEYGKALVVSRELQKQCDMLFFDFWSCKKSWNQISKQYIIMSYDVVKWSKKSVVLMCLNRYIFSPILKISLHILWQDFSWGWGSHIIR